MTVTLRYTRFKEGRSSAPNFSREPEEAFQISPASDFSGHHLMAFYFLTLSLILLEYYTGYPRLDSISTVRDPTKLTVAK
jgi:hypothetical protein